MAWRCWLRHDWSGPRPLAERRGFERLPAWLRFALGCVATRVCRRCGKVKPLLWDGGRVGKEDGDGGATDVV